jgi:hypothetical protein
MFTVMFAMLVVVVIRVDVLQCNRPRSLLGEYATPVGYISILKHGARDSSII